VNSQTTFRPERLRRRAEFLAMRGGKRFHAAAFVLQARARSADESGGDQPRFGFTVTKKIGNAVERNRIKRRLREVVRSAAPGHAMPDFDYVLIARREALGGKFDAMVDQLAEGLDRTAPMGANPRQRDRVPSKGTAPSAANQRSGGK